jgi:uncharacterized protein YbaR (Trm112 family)
MRIKTIEKLCCPFDKGNLDLQIFAQDLQQNVQEGILSCPVCKRDYPIVYGVPIMSPDEYRQPRLEQPVLEKWELEYGYKQHRLE